MANLDTTIPTSLKAALDAEVARTKRTLSSVVTAALSEYLGVPVHTLFQVSTSGALVAGVYDREVSVKAILEHGDFGLGTFANLDGEMVVLDGRVYQVQGTGHVSEASPDAGAPFAVVTRFSPQTEVDTEAVASFKDLEARCDKYRYLGNNIFYAVRLDGHFTRVRTRAVKPPHPGAGLVDAAKAQREFTFTDIDGTLVGLWSPDFSSAFSVSGYHFHFLSKDRQHGGHLLDVEAGPLRLKVEALTDFHLALPESEAFLKANLSKNTAEQLAYAEQAHKEVNNERESKIHSEINRGRGFEQRTADRRGTGRSHARNRRCDTCVRHSWR
jgi:acetolactate decarboxylase